ncbi:MAG: hypothetical protein HQL64_09720 [Magnetococcales bacterium]|nr:hypothetical protein [Magnetococcales bacterium]
MLRQLEDQAQITVQIKDDEEGYLDRECPSDECLFQFKVLSEDWAEKIRDEEVYCPNCGHTNDSGKWWTQEQIEHARQATFAQIATGINETLERDADRWNRRQPSSSFISMTMKVNGRPQYVLLPPAATEPMRLKITCPACACRYAVVGAAYFCPACGHNAADQQFAQTINGIRLSLDALNAVLTAIPDRDTAESTKRLLIENGLQNAITAFQRCVEAIYFNLPSTPKARRNAFQNLREGDQLWQTATGKSYAAHLKTDEFSTLQRVFQQRHLLAHTQGIVDQEYITKSGDMRYKLGQRIVVRPDAVLEVLNLIEKLVIGLLADIDII